MSPEDFACLDFEASGLSSRSWPIEVGLSWIENGVVRTWGSLIKPEPNWSMEAWSPASAEVHGIDLTELESAPDAAFVAGELFRVLGSRKLVSDAREFERRWLSRLTDVLGHAVVPPIADFDLISHWLFGGLALEIVYETLAQSPAPHRAEPDSARLANAWLTATKVEPTGR